MGSMNTRSLTFSHTLPPGALKPLQGSIRIGAVASLDIDNTFYSKGMPISQAWEMFSE